jgi:hypothetical protein
MAHGVPKILLIGGAALLAAIILLADTNGPIVSSRALESETGVKEIVNECQDDAKEILGCTSMKECTDILSELLKYVESSQDEANYRLTSSSRSRIYDEAEQRAKLANPIHVIPRVDKTLPVLVPLLEKFKPKAGWQSSLFPDFTVVGMQQAGTLQLTHILSSHPKASFAGSGCSGLHFPGFGDVGEQEKSDIQEELYNYFNSLPAAAKDDTLSVGKCGSVDDLILRAKYLM